MKHRFKLLIGISLLAGFASSTLLHKPKDAPPQLRGSEFFLGSWRKNEAPVTEAAFLIISEVGLFTLNQLPLAGKIIQLDEQRLVFEDNYGYQLILEKMGINQLSLFDDAEDREYILERIETKEV